MKINPFTIIVRAAVLSALIAATLPLHKASALGNRLFVKPRGEISGACSNWATACELHYVISSVAVSGDEIWVQAGVHEPASVDRSGTFAIPDGLKIYGGFEGGETLLSQRKPKTNVTVLSGNYNADGLYHVVTIDGAGPTTVLDGFTITGGQADGGGANQSIGGGMLILSGSPVLSNLVFIKNEATTNGGGLYTGTDTGPTLKNVSFDSNSANEGGGMYASYSSPILKKASFSMNRASAGGGLYNLYSNPQLSSVSFTGNWASDSGGGMYELGNGSVLKQVKFISNQAGAYGGGMHSFMSSNTTIIASRFTGNYSNNGGGLFINSSSLSLTDVTFESNSATDYGGGLINYNNPSTILRNVTFNSNTANSGGGMVNIVSSTLIRNTTFSGNAAMVGGALYNDGSEPTLNNVTMSGNTAYSHAGGMLNISSAVVAHNSIFWGNSGNQIENELTATVSMDHSVLQGGCPAGNPSFTCSTIATGNPKLGPLANNGGLTKTRALLAGSSAIDKGAPGTCEGKDQRGVSRPQGIRCDLGAYEFIP